MEPQQAVDNSEQEEDGGPSMMKFAALLFMMHKKEGEAEEGFTPMDFVKVLSEVRIEVRRSYEEGISRSHDWYSASRYDPAGHKSRKETDENLERKEDEINGSMEKLKEPETTSQQVNKDENLEIKEDDTNGSMEMLMNKFHELYIRDTCSNTSIGASVGEGKEKEKQVNKDENLEIKELKMLMKEFHELYIKDKQVERRGVDLIEKYFKDQSNSYNFATREHPFIQRIRTGATDFSFFKQWLGQRRIFARRFVGFAADIDTSDNGFVMEGLTKLISDLIWFEKETSQWDVQPSNNNRTDLTRWYCGFLHDIGSLHWSHPAIITAFWLILSFYDKVFSYCLEEGSKAPPELIATCRRWVSDGFRSYCDSISKIADRCLTQASENELNMTANMVYYCLVYENMFLYMCLGEC